MGDPGVYLGEGNSEEEIKANSRSLRQVNA